MHATVDDRHADTRETAWQDAAPWEGVPGLSLDVDRVVVLAARPDEETLGAGGLLTSAARNGIDVSVLVVTDGESPHPGFDASAPRRRGELIAAVHELAPRAAVSFLAVPEGGIRAARAAVSEALAAHLSAGRARRTLIVAPWRADGDDDHRVLGDVARAFAGEGVRVVGYPLWFWRRADPARVDTDGWRVLALDAEATAAKRRALAAHTSRLRVDESGVDADLLTPFERPFEVFVEPGDDDDAKWTTARFDAFHSRHDDPWGLASRWYERRKRALMLAALPRERFAHVLELGSATGVTTRALAERATTVLGVDASAVALEKARAGGVPAGVTFERHELPDDWPEGTFDLVVLSELAYYWTPEQFGRALDRIAACTSDDAVLVACHWRKTVEGTPLTGDDVHAAISARAEWRVLARHVEEDFLMDVLVRPEVPSVAGGAEVR